MSDSGPRIATDSEMTLLKQITRQDENADQHVAGATRSAGWDTSLLAETESVEEGPTRSAGWDGGLFSDPNAPSYDKVMS